MGIRDTTSSKPFTVGQVKMWKLINISIVVLTSIFIFVYCIEYEEDVLDQKLNAHGYYVASIFWYAWSLIVISFTAMLVLFSLFSLNKIMALLNQ